MPNMIKFSFLILLGMSLSFVLSITFGTPEFAIALMTTIFNSTLRIIVVINSILLAIVVVESFCSSSN